MKSEASESSESRAGARPPCACLAIGGRRRRGGADRTCGEARGTPAFGRLRLIIFKLDVPVAPVDESAKPRFKGAAADGGKSSERIGETRNSGGDNGSVVASGSAKLLRLGESHSSMYAKK